MTNDEAFSAFNLGTLLDVSIGAFLNVNFVIA